MRQADLLRDVRYESRVSKAVDEAILKWPGAERAWLAVEHVLSHDPLSNGAAITESGTKKAFVFHGAQSVGIPDVTVIFSATSELVIVYDAEFKKSRFPFQGNA